ncbi:MAG: hypothetical protein LBQ01_08365 [Prevotellaceae bacterium]|jgi:hypothetical protein|nr:hypothetical protein [Prevotellaceae bacterium]
MKKLVFIFAVALTLLCNNSVKSQSEDLVKRTQDEMVKTVDWLYDRFGDFDRECFLTGTLDDSHGHYQTFTANKSRDEIDGKVKWLFGEDSMFIPDTVRRQRITAYMWYDDVLAIFVAALFKNDYPDVRAFRVCSVRPFVRYYCSEVKTADRTGDPVCNKTTNYEIELFSPSLAKTVAGYHNFDCDSVSAVSSGGDIGYSGVIKEEKIATDAQKMSFLAGVFIRYHCSRPLSDDDSSMYSIPIPDSFNTLKMCVNILKESGCDIVKEVPAQTVVFRASDKIRNLASLAHELDDKISSVFYFYPEQQK